MMIELHNTLVDAATHLVDNIGEDANILHPELLLVSQHDKLRQRVSDLLQAVVADVATVEDRMDQRRVLREKLLYSLRYQIQCLEYESHTDKEKEILRRQRALPVRANESNKENYIIHSALSRLIRQLAGDFYGDASQDDWYAGYREYYTEYTRRRFEQIVHQADDNEYLLEEAIPILKKWCDDIEQHLLQDMDLKLDMNNVKKDIHELSRTVLHDTMMIDGQHEPSQLIHITE